MRFAVTFVVESLRGVEMMARPASRKITSMPICQARHA